MLSLQQMYEWLHWKQKLEWQPEPTCWPQTQADIFTLSEDALLLFKNIRMLSQNTKTWGNEHLSLCFCHCKACSSDYFWTSVISWQEQNKGCVLPKGTDWTRRWQHVWAGGQASLVRYEVNMLRCLQPTRSSSLNSLEVTVETKWAVALLIVGL